MLLIDSEIGEVRPPSIKTVGLPLIRLFANTTEVNPTVLGGPLAVKLMSPLFESNCRFEIVELLEICRYVGLEAIRPDCVEDIVRVVKVVVAVTVRVTV